MNEAVDAPTGQPGIGGALGGCDLTMRPAMADAVIPERRDEADEGMVRAEDLSRQLRDLPPDLVQLPLVIGSQRRLRVKLGEVRLDRFQARLGHIQSLGDLRKG
jgi:hypothetical protein